MPRANISEPQKAGEYLAAERTFLAWIRTSVSVISLGFVIAKFGVWLRELALRLDPSAKIRSTGMSLPIGSGMMATGGIVALLALWHFHVVNLAIERGEVRPNRGLAVTVAVAVAAVSVLVIIYMLLTAENG